MVQQRLGRMLGEPFFFAHLGHRSEGAKCLVDSTGPFGQPGFFAVRRQRRFDIALREVRLSSLEQLGHQLAASIGLAEQLDELEANGQRVFGRRGGLLEQPRGEL